MTLRSNLLTRRVTLAEARAEDPEARVLEQIVRGVSAANGAEGSGVVQARHARRFETLRAFLRMRLDLEREHRLAVEDMTSWHDALIADIRAIVTRNAERLGSEYLEDWSRFGGGLPAPREARQGLSDEIARLRDECLGEADLLKNERELAGRVPEVSSMVVVNISHGQVAALDLGQVLGNIQAAVNGLNASGQQELAEALKTLTEAVAAPRGLPPDQQRESVELVEALGEECARGRRPSRLRAYAARIAQLVAESSEASGAGGALKTVARLAGFVLS